MQRSSQLRRSAPLRQVSAKRAKLLRRRKEIIEQAPRESCFCHREPALEHHEILRRAQRASTAADVTFMIPIGAKCHRWVTEHPTKAHDMGLVLWSHEADDEDAIKDAERKRLELAIRPIMTASNRKR